MTALPIPPAPLPDKVPHVARDLAHRLDAIFFCLLHYIGYAAHILGRFAAPAEQRINRAGQRLRRILHRIAAGTFPAPRPPSPTKRKGGPKQPYLPRRRGWLGHVAGHNLRGIASQLTHLLNDPQTQATLAAAPPHAQAAFARALATTARLLAIDLPPLLQRPTTPKPPKPKKPRPPRPKPAPLFPPLQPRVLAAARYYRQKFGREKAGTGA